MAKRKSPAKSTTEKALAARTKALNAKIDLLSGSTVYLSGPMDFVASRKEEKEFGWRNRVSQFLDQYGVRIFDPWNKPMPKGMGHYGKEDEFSASKRDSWSFADSRDGDRTRAELSSEFWPTLHIDLRMTDTADFLVAFVPTNVYSVGTVHEIVMARLQHKPVLFVSPPVTFPTYDELDAHLEQRGDAEGRSLLSQLAAEAPLRPNPRAIPSMWYMALIDAHYFFDGFGFAGYRKSFGWKKARWMNMKRPFLPSGPYCHIWKSSTRWGCQSDSISIAENTLRIPSG